MTLLVQRPKLSLMIYLVILEAVIFCPQKVVWYFLIIPHLKRLFANKKIAKMLGCMLKNAWMMKSSSTQWMDLIVELLITSNTKLFAWNHTPIMMESSTPPDHSLRWWRAHHCRIIIKLDRQWWSTFTIGFEHMVITLLIIAHFH